MVRPNVGLGPISGQYHTNIEWKCPNLIWCQSINLSTLQEKEPIEATKVVAKSVFVVTIVIYRRQSRRYMSL